MFRGARSKINRATKHIQDVESLAREVEQRHTSVVQKHPNGGCSIKYEFPGIDDTLRDISLATGDAIHNLRTALDHAWVESFARLNLVPTKWTRFPFPDGAQKLEDTLRGGKVDILAPKLFKWITDIKPYPGGNAGSDVLCVLHEADIMDKHKLILPVVAYTGLSGIRVEDETGREITGDSWLLIGSGPAFLHLEPTVKIKDQGHVSCQVVLSEFPVFKSPNVVEMLRILECCALNTIESLEKVVFQFACAPCHSSMLRPVL